MGSSVRHHRRPSDPSMKLHWGSMWQSSRKGLPASYCWRVRSAHVFRPSTVHSGPSFTYGFGHLWYVAKRYTYSLRVLSQGSRVTQKTSEFGSAYGFGGAFSQGGTCHQEHWLPSGIFWGAPVSVRPACLLWKRPSSVPCSSARSSIEVPAFFGMWRNT